MNKILILFILLTNSVFASEPKFSKGDSVLYNVKTFYKNVCSGIGTIEEYHQDSDGTIDYLVITESGCPNMYVPESQLKRKEK
jgi:hypothetical protein